jgi:hypothetical protein
MLSRGVLIDKPERGELDLPKSAARPAKSRSGRCQPK